ncbi:MAG: autotransporter-associated beta strand repeat-containing protein [Methylacidiphilales bacterium]|nr:autotransporter-associated beta strand repeat-containing protein [Candidatus Methylacidiphilales bacterium]
MNGNRPPKILGLSSSELTNPAKSWRYRIYLSFTSICLLGFIFSLHLLAATFTWNGNGADNLWGTGANWVGGVAPGAVNDDLVFAGTNKLNPQYNYSNYDKFNSIVFASSAGSFHITNAVGNNNKLEINHAGKIENQSTNQQKISLVAISVGGGGGAGSYIEMNPVQGNLVIDSNVETHGRQVRIWGDNAKAIFFDKPIEGAGGTVDIRQNSNVYFNAANTNTGTIFIGAGTLFNGINNAINPASNVVLYDSTFSSVDPTWNLQTYNNTINQLTLNVGHVTGSTGQLSATGGIIAHSGTISAIIQSTPFFDKVSNGTVVLSGASSNNYTGPTAVKAGTLALNKTPGQNATGTGTIFVADSSGTTSATLLWQNNNQIQDNVTINIRAGGIMHMQSFADAIGRIIFDNANTTNSSAPQVQGTNTLTLTAATNTIQRLDYGNTQGVTGINIQPHIHLPGPTHQFVNDDQGTHAAGVFLNGNLTANNVTVEVLGNRNDGAFFQLNGSNSGFSGGTFVLGRITNNPTEQRQGRLYIEDSAALPSPSTLFEIRRGSLQFLDTMNVPNNILLSGNQISGTPNPADSPQHRAPKYIEAPTAGTTVTISGNITTNTTDYDTNPANNPIVQFVGHLGGGAQSTIYLTGNNDFGNSPVSVITGTLRLEDNAAHNGMADIALGVNRVTGINYGRDTGLLVDSGTFNKNITVAQNQGNNPGPPDDAFSGPGDLQNYTGNTGNRTIGTTSPSANVQFTGNITLGTNNSTVIYPVAAANIYSLPSNDTGAANVRLIADGSATSRAVFHGLINEDSDNAASSVTKVGAGIVELKNNNLYDGGTIVTAGTLLVNNTPGASGTGSGNVTVQSGATLAGTGQAGTGTANVTIQSGAILSPGDVNLSGQSQIGHLTVSNLTLNPNSIFNVQIGAGDTNAALSTNDRIISLGNFNLPNGNITINVTTTVGTPLWEVNQYKWDIADWATLSNSGVSITWNLPTITNPNLYWDTSLFLTNGIIQIVPEPSTYAVAALIISLLLFTEYRRRRNLSQTTPN